MLEQKIAALEGQLLNDGDSMQVPPAENSPSTVVTQNAHDSQRSRASEASQHTSGIREWLPLDMHQDTKKFLSQLR